MAMQLPKLPDGEKRQFYKCLDCGKPQFHDFVPFGIGFGRRYNQCLCQLTSNRSHRLKKITRKLYESLTWAWIRKEARAAERAAAKMPRVTPATILVVDKDVDARVTRALREKKSIFNRLMAGRP